MTQKRSKFLPLQMAFDVKLVELAESQHEREQKGKEESKDDASPLIVRQENEQAEQALMEHEEELMEEFKRDCATEWNRRRLAREYASVDGEGFGRDGIYRVDRFGCMEMYVGEFDEDPPSEPTAAELWEEYVGGKPQRISSRMSDSTKNSCASGGANT